MERDFRDPVGEEHICEVCFMAHVPDPCCSGCPCGTGDEEEQSTELQGADKEQSCG